MIGSVSGLFRRRFFSFPIHMSKQRKHGASPTLAYLCKILQEQDPESLEGVVARHLAACVKRFGEEAFTQAARITDGFAEAYSRCSRIAGLNDRLRTTFTGGQVVLTRGIAALPPQDKAAVLKQVREFDRFTKDNDPWGEHDFGLFEHDGLKIYWKIDYYDADIRYGSQDPCDPDITTRVLTVLLSTEY
jgi:hypothetical protein